MNVGGAGLLDYMLITRSACVAMETIPTQPARPSGLFASLAYTVKRIFFSQVKSSYVLLIISLLP